MQNQSTTIQGVISIAALLCLVVGWFRILPPDITDFLYNKLFYILVGASFYFAAQTYPNQNHRYIAYAAALLCIIGPFLPGSLEMVKTIGLFAGVVLTFFARPRVR